MKINKEIQGGVSLVQVLDETNIVVYVVDREEGASSRSSVIVWDLAQQCRVAELAMASEVRALLIRRDCLVVVLQR